MSLEVTLLQGPYKDRVIQKMRDQYHHETKPSDGEVYRKVRYYQKNGEDRLAQNWMIRLSNRKQRSLAQWFLQNDLVEALDQLLDFPGLWFGLEIGNFTKHIGVHCNEEIICYIVNRIFRFWDAITLGIPALRQAVDIPTVLSLQSRAPSASQLDRAHITTEFQKGDKGALFSTVTDGSLREHILKSLLQRKEIFPTIKSWHENMKIVEIGARIIKNHLLDGPIKTTLYQAMISRWKAPENIMVEIQEGEFQYTTLPRGEDQAKFAYNQVFLSTFREFPNLSNVCPRRERLQKVVNTEPDPGYKLLLIRRANIVGFGHPKILQGIKNGSEISVPRLNPTKNLDGECLKRRLGRPFSNAHAEAKGSLFLPYFKNMEAEAGQNPSALFVLQDTFNAFFNPDPISEISVTGPKVTISAPVTVQSSLEQQTSTFDRGVNENLGSALDSSDSSLSTRSSVSTKSGASPEQLTREMQISPRLAELANTLSRTVMRGTSDSSCSGTVIMSSAEIEHNGEFRSPLSALFFQGSDDHQLSDINSSSTVDRQSYLEPIYGGQTLSRLLSSQESHSPPSISSGETTLVGSESPGLLENSVFEWDRRTYLKSAHSFHGSENDQLLDISSSTTDSLYRQSYLEPRYGAHVAPKTPNSLQSVDCRSFLTIGDGHQPTYKGNPPDNPQMKLSDMTLCQPSVEIKVLEYNGMYLSQKPVMDVKQYLRHRSQGWTGILINGDSIKTLRPEVITKHIMNKDFAMVKSRSINQFKQVNSKTVPGRAGADRTLTRRVRKKARIA